MKYFISTIFIFLFVSYAFCFDYKKFDSVKTISSDFVMEKHLSIAQAPLISKGHFYFEKSSLLYWSYQTPFISGYLLENSKVYSWKVIGNNKKVEDITKQVYAKKMIEYIYMFISMDIEKISKFYNVVENETSLELYPKNNKQENTLEKIELHFDMDKIIVKQVDIIDKSKDNTIIYFNNSVINEDIPQNFRDIISEK